VTKVSIRELRNAGGEVIARAARGEEITITNAGEPVAQLRALPPRGVSAAALLERWRRLPPVDPERLRADLDRALDARL
jgi:antitoxin (DNA-binding transcriptional repressor) of toxin-antitoxin stability system